MRLLQAVIPQCAISTTVSPAVQVKQPEGAGLAARPLCPLSGKTILLCPPPGILVLTADNGRGRRAEQPNFQGDRIRMLAVSQGTMCLPDSLIWAPAIDRKAFLSFRPRWA